MSEEMKQVAGDVFYACPDELELLRQRTVKHCLLSTFPAHGGKDVALYTHPASAVPEVDDLAQFIRQVDGKHEMGAGALAERICDWLASRTQEPT